MKDLFSAAAPFRPAPLAATLRPDTLEGIVGQDHLLGKGKPLRLRAELGRFGTVILFGPPGTGKTTIARALGKKLGKDFVPLHPARNSTADIRRTAEEAKVRETLVFIDEIHRFSATVQDMLLEMSEEGVFDLLGATSMNPYHTLTPALVSRAQVFELKPLGPADMERLVLAAAGKLKADGPAVTFEGKALSMLAGRAGGDARRALNTLESVTLGAAKGEKVTVTEEAVADAYQASPIPYDRKGDAHYDVISAFVKSMRGGDPDATLYWLARLVHAGEDPRYIARRIMIHASEDVGLADNTALQTAVAASAAVEKIGYPEARIVLAHAALHVCRAPKSGSAYAGIARALEAVAKEPVKPVPMHLRDTHYEGAAPLGRGGYRSPHSDPAGWLEQEYAPGVEPGRFYLSEARGGATFERRADQFWEAVTGRPVPTKFGDGKD